MPRLFGAVEGKRCGSTRTPAAPTIGKSWVPNNFPSGSPSNSGRSVMRFPPPSSRPAPRAASWLPWSRAVERLDIRPDLSTTSPMVGLELRCGCSSRTGGLGRDATDAVAVRPCVANHWAVVAAVGSQLPVAAALASSPRPAAATTALATLLEASDDQVAEATATTTAPPPPTASPSPDNDGSSKLMSVLPRDDSGFEPDRTA
mmetsp:Transcript_118833/g.379110  ORF Transcript_118833/g.379110 Transcript_118833/m.379110 type:complete len:203 (+) Transcript_118833:869-1477(+)